MRNPSLIWIASLLIITVLSCPALAAPTPEEKAIFDIINEERQKASVEPLAWDSTLYSIALAHSQEMLKYYYFSHKSPITNSTPQDRVSASRYYSGYYGPQVVKENIYLRSAALDVEKMNASVMERETMRERRLSSEVNQGAVACANGPYLGHGTTWICTELFAYKGLGTYPTEPPVTPPVEEIKDSDGDGIPDSEDRCPYDPETLNNYQDDDGCPDSPPDSDGDGIPDSVDECPFESETRNSYQDSDGCPDVKPATKSHECGNAKCESIYEDCETCPADCLCPTKPDDGQSTEEQPIIFPLLTFGVMVAFIVLVITWKRLYGGLGERQKKQPETKQKPPAHAKHKKSSRMSKEDKREEMKRKVKAAVRGREPAEGFDLEENIRDMDDLTELLDEFK